MRKPRKGYVSILASKRNGALYIGVTSNQSKRIYEHKNDIFKGFKSKYSVKALVCYEEHELISSAIQRGKSLKRWPRQWKINVIEERNPNWEEIIPSPWQLDSRDKPWNDGVFICPQK